MSTPSHLNSLRTELSNTAVARALAGELGDVITDCRDLELVVAEIFSSFPQGQLLQRLQAFDLIIQKVRGCANVLEALADHAPESWLSSEQILAGVSLSAQASRLSGQVDATVGRVSGDAEIW